MHVTLPHKQAWASCESRQCIIFYYIYGCEYIIHNSQVIYEKEDRFVGIVEGCIVLDFNMQQSMKTIVDI